jgi:hypothetical protein
MLPDELMTKSLSDKDIVLPYEAALCAIDLLAASGWALLGWEGWLKYPDGRVGHSARHQGTVSLEKQAGESWGAYVQRSSEFCKRTVMENQEEWNRSPEAADSELYFCLTIMEPTHSIL